MINYDDVYKIGRIGKPHGVKGEVAFRFTDDVFDTAGADCLFLGIDGILVPFFIDEYRFHGAETALVKFFDVDTREQADAIVGCDVYIPRSLAADGDGQLSLQALAGYTIPGGGGLHHHRRRHRRRGGRRKLNRRLHGNRALRHRRRNNGAGVGRPDRPHRHRRPDHNGKAARRAA